MHTEIELGPDLLRVGASTHEGSSWTSTYLRTPFLPPMETFTKPGSLPVENTAMADSTGISAGMMLEQSTVQS